MSKKTTTTAENKADESVKRADYARAPINASLGKEEKIELYRKMVRIRRFEERSLIGMKLK